MSRKDSIFFFFNVIYYCLTDLFLSLRHVIAYSKIAFFCQLTMTWKRHSMPVNKQNCSYSIRHLFSSSYSSFPLLFVFFFSLLVLLSPVTCTYSYVTIAALVRRRPLHINIHTHTRERASNHSILLTTTTTIHRLVYMYVHV